MGRTCAILGWISIAMGIAVGILTAASDIAPEGSWSRWALLSHAWVRASLAALLIALGLALLLLGRRLGHATPDTFLTREEERDVVGAIAEFENVTSGEIRVHLAGGTRGHLLETAGETFEKLGMTRTRERNGVLFFVDVREQKLAVVGDRGINAVVGDGFWDRIVSDMRAAFRRGEHARGLILGIRAAGEALAAHFPPRLDDVNELPDEISREPE